MYGSDLLSDSTYTVNRTTGAWTLVGNTGQVYPYQMGWDGATMYGVTGLSAASTR